MKKHIWKFRIIEYCVAFTFIFWTATIFALIEMLILDIEPEQVSFFNGLSYFLVYFPFVVVLLGEFSNRRNYDLFK